jgi:hypothetical protein
MLILDYVLTYIGIRIGIIEEANPIMKWLFELSFMDGIIIRIAISILLLIPYYFIKKTRIKIYNKLIIIVCVGYSLIFLLHLSWVLDFLKQ